MIHLDLTIKFPPGNERAEELVRHRLRQAMLQFIFENVDAVADVTSAGVRHHEVTVDGTIQIKEEA